MKNFIPIVNHSLKYNPSIDGLRGIAISIVLIFHIWPEYFSFGYVGVDIFFVLSGYLITQIIYTKLESNSFSLKEFYRNRIRRIFPDKKNVSNDICKLPLEKYLDRYKEYRDYIFELSKKYTNTNIRFLNR